MFDLSQKKAIGKLLILVGGVFSDKTIFLEQK